jgi:hypothetical protein
MSRGRRVSRRRVEVLRSGASHEGDSGIARPVHYATEALTFGTASIERERDSLPASRMTPERPLPPSELPFERPRAAGRGPGLASSEFARRLAALGWPRWRPTLVGRQAPGRSRPRSRPDGTRSGTGGLHGVGRTTRTRGAAGRPAARGAEGYSDAADRMPRRHITLKYRTFPTHSDRAARCGTCLPRRKP